MKTKILILFLFASTIAFGQAKITTNYIVANGIKSLTADSNIYIHDTLKYHDGTKDYSANLKTDSTNTATVTMTWGRVLHVLAGGSVTAVVFPAFGNLEGMEITIINNKVGAIAVTAHRDLTGAFSISQAAQSAVRYVYISGWKKVN